MNEHTRQLRELLASHEAADNWRLFRMALDLMDEQQKQINDLRETISNQYQRHSNQVADLRKQIDKLSGVHGA